MAMNRKLFALLAALSFVIVSCDKPTPTPEPQDPTNYFNYEGYSFDINSVVKYEKGDNAIELWLSSETGLKTTSEIMNAGDYVVLNTNKEYLDKRDRFNAATSKGSYIRFCNEVFSYGDSGTAYIEVSIDGDVITLTFMAQNLYTKAQAGVKAAIQGTYSGSYTKEEEVAYSNEWGVDRNRNKVSSVVYTTYENGSDSEIVLYGENCAEAIHLTFKPDLINKQTYLPSSSKITLAYGGGIPFNLSNASGSINTSVTEGNIEVAIDVTDGKKRIRASYKGEFESKIAKENRYKYSYEGGESPYEGRHDIVKLMVENRSGQCKLFFSPSEGYTMDKANSTHMPILTVPSEIINAGKKFFNEIDGWEFAFDLMEAWPYEDEYRPHATATDWIMINKTDNLYEVEFVMTSVATGMDPSSIDVYFKGEASK